jgi:prolyl-tRNA editing enzyme YbaK/EbsC (Cys-tRNA(Pro) deacylase)
MQLATRSIGRDVRLATEDELMGKIPWCSPGCLPAFGGLLGMPEYIDPEVCQRHIAVFSAGEPERSIEMDLQQLIQIEPNVHVAALCGTAD